MVLASDDLAAMALALDASEDYRVLRRLTFRKEFTPAQDPPFKIGILLDVETTGLSTASDEVIELGLVKFSYLLDGRVGAVIDTYSSFNEPTKPIPEEVTNLNGITNEMVAGHRIDPATVDAFVSDAVVSIAHNASFDRRFAERYWPAFAHKSWACSVNEVEWRKHGFEGSRLGYLSQASACSTKRTERSTIVMLSLKSRSEDHTSELQSRF